MAVYTYDEEADTLYVLLTDEAQAAIDRTEEIGAAESPYVTDLNEGTLAIVRRHLDETAFAEAWEQGRKLTVDEAVALALQSRE